MSLSKNFSISKHVQKTTYLSLRKKKGDNRLFATETQKSQKENQDIFDISVMSIIA